MVKLNSESAAGGNPAKTISVASVAAIAILGIVIAGALLFYLVQFSAPKYTSVDVRREVAECHAKVLSEIRPKAVDITLSDQISNHCIDEVYDIYNLDDFGSRREAFTRQYSSGNLIVWLVVSITISGIVLAGIQLAAAYNLSAINGRALDAGGSISIEQRKLTLNSTVTGLIILALSFAFFLTYVIYVFPIKETKAVEVEPQKKIEIPASDPPIAKQPQFSNPSLGMPGQLFSNAFGPHPGITTTCPIIRQGPMVPPRPQMRFHTQSVRAAPSTPASNAQRCAATLK